MKRILNQPWLPSVLFLLICSSVGLWFAGNSKQPVGSFLQASLLNPATTHQAVIKTDQGNITLNLFAGTAPIAVKNFVGLTQRGLYDQVPMHETKPGLYVQTGDYEFGDGTGGKSLWKQPFADEISEQKTHKRGTVSMANLGPNTNGSQFFILLQDRAYLDDRHTIIGEVTEGLEIVESIAAAPADDFGRPKNPVLMQSVRIK